MSDFLPLCSKDKGYNEAVCQNSDLESLLPKDDQDGSIDRKTNNVKKTLSSLIQMFENGSEKIQEKNKTSLQEIKETNETHIEGSEDKLVEYEKEECAKTAKEECEKAEKKELTKFENKEWVKFENKEWENFENEEWAKFENEEWAKFDNEEWVEFENECIINKEFETTQKEKDTEKGGKNNVEVKGDEKVEEGIDTEIKEEKDANTENISDEEIFKNDFDDEFIRKNKDDCMDKNICKEDKVKNFDNAENKKFNDDEISTNKATEYEDIYNENLKFNFENVEEEIKKVTYDFPRSLTKGIDNTSVIKTDNFAEETQKIELTYKNTLTENQSEETKNKQEMPMEDDKINISTDLRLKTVEKKTVQLPMNKKEKLLNVPSKQQHLLDETKSEEKQSKNAFMRNIKKFMEKTKKDNSENQDKGEPSQINKFGAMKKLKKCSTKLMSKIAAQDTTENTPENESSKKNKDLHLRKQNIQELPKMSDKFKHLIINEKPGCSKWYEMPGGSKNCDDKPRMPSRNEKPSIPNRDEKPKLPKKGKKPNVPNRDEMPSVPNRDEKPRLPNRNEKPYNANKDESQGEKSEYLYIDEDFTEVLTEEDNTNKYDLKNKSKCSNTKYNITEEETKVEMKEDDAKEKYNTQKEKREKMKIEMTKNREERKEIVRGYVLKGKMFEEKPSREIKTEQLPESDSSESKIEKRIKIESELVKASTSKDMQPINDNKNIKKPGILKRKNTFSEEEVFNNIDFIFTYEDENNSGMNIMTDEEIDKFLIDYDKTELLPLVVKKNCSEGKKDIPAAETSSDNDKVEENEKNKDAEEETEMKKKENILKEDKTSETYSPEELLAYGRKCLNMIRYIFWKKTQQTGDGNFKFTLKADDGEIDITFKKKSTQKKNVEFKEDLNTIYVYNPHNNDLLQVLHLSKEDIAKILKKTPKAKRV